MPIDFAPPQGDIQAPVIAPPNYNQNEFASSQALANLKTSQQQQQQMQAVTQGINIENQQKQQALKDQQILAQSLMTLGQPSSPAQPSQGGMTQVPGLVTPVPAGAVTPLPGQPAEVTAMQQRAPSAPPNPMAGLDLGQMARAGASGSMLQSLATGQMKYAADRASLTEQQQKIQDTNHADAAATLKGLYDAPPDLMAQGWAPAKAKLQALAPDDAYPFPDTPPADPKQAQQLLAMHLGLLGAHDSLVANAKSAAETEKAIQETAASKATTAETQQKTRIAQAQADAIDLWKQGLQAGSDGGADMIRHSVGFNTQAAQGFIDRYNIAAKSGNYAEAQKVLTDAAQYGVENNPTTMGLKAKQAGATAMAELPARQSEAAFGNALQQQSTARGKIQDSLADYGQTADAAKTLQQYIDLSRSGNPAAAQSIKALVPALQLSIFDIKRLSGIPGADEGLGTLAQKATGILKSAGDAVPLTDAQLNDIEPLLKTVANGAAMRHNSIATSVEAAYPQAFAQGKAPRVNMPYPQAMPGAAVPANVKSLLGAPTVQPGIHTLSDGSRWMKNKDGSLSPM